MKVGSQEWFEQRAFENLNKISEGLWDYSDSALIWTPGVAEEYARIQRDESESYKNKVADSSTKMTELVANKIVDLLPAKINFIDLGPGTEDKQDIFLGPMERRGKDVLYVPVDINKEMLEQADDHVKKLGFETKPLLAEFSEAKDVLEKIDGYKFISLGPTFMNYDPSKILNIIRRMVGKGSIFLMAQVRDRIDIEAIKNQYRDQAAGILRRKIELLGLDFDSDIESAEADDSIKVYVTLKNTNEKLDSLGLESGDKLEVLKSYRYTVEDFKKALDGFRYDLFDEGVDFIGALVHLD